MPRFIVDTDAKTVVLMENQESKVRASADVLTFPVLIEEYNHRFESRGELDAYLAALQRREENLNSAHRNDNEVMEGADDIRTYTQEEKEDYLKVIHILLPHPEIVGPRNVIRQLASFLDAGGINETTAPANGMTVERAKELWNIAALHDRHQATTGRVLAALSRV